MHRTAIPLGACQMLFMAAAAVSLSFNGLVGEMLAPNNSLSTLPFLFMTVSTALLTLILPKLMHQIGYRGLFSLGVLMGFAGALGSAWAVWTSSFFIFCVACTLSGGYQASTLYYRFAAAEIAPPAQKSNAMAWVLSGGIVAALVGPWLGGETVDLLTPKYLGAYLLTALLALLAIPVLLSARLPGRRAAEAKTDAAPLKHLVRHPALLPAVVFCAGGYAMMMFVMLSAPFAIHHGGHTAQDAASVIQWHLLGMFTPSLFTGKLIARFGAEPLAKLGCVILASGCAISLVNPSLTGFHLSLLFVGVGWNFMYLGGSTILALVPNEQERSRLQSLNEFITFGIMTITAGATGWFYHALGWQSVLAAASALVLVFAVIAGVSQRNNKAVSITPS